MITKKKLFDILPYTFHDGCLQDAYFDNGTLYAYFWRDPVGFDDHPSDPTTLFLIVEFDHVTDLQTYVWFAKPENEYIPYADGIFTLKDEDCVLFGDIFELYYTDDNYVEFSRCMKFRCDDVKVLAHSGEELDFSKYCNKYRDKIREQQKVVKKNRSQRQKYKKPKIEFQQILNEDHLKGAITAEDLFSMYTFENCDVLFSKSRQIDDELIVTFSLDKSLQNETIKRAYGGYIENGNYNYIENNDYKLLLTVSFQKCEKIRLYKQVYTEEKDFFEKNKNYVKKWVHFSDFDKFAKTLSVFLSKDKSQLNFTFKEYIDFGYIEIIPETIVIIKECCVANDIIG